MITIQDLAKRYAARTLFEGVSLQLNAGERYGLVGANGSGKSTFARILAGAEGASDGTISIPKRARVGVLEQDRFESDEQRILDVAMMGDREVWSAMKEKAALLEERDIDAHRLGELEELILARDGYALEGRAGEVLEGLGIPTALHQEPLRVLSGGFKLRALLAQTLAASPDLLVLDEPTNHLDIVSIRWLEQFLVGFSGCAVIVSHDRRFLDNVCSYIADVDYETITLYRGDYEKFVVEKAADRERREKEIDKQKAKIQDHQEFIDRFKAKASKARQAQSKVKQMEKITFEELPESSRRTPRFSFPQKRPSGKEVVEAKGLKKAYHGKPVLDDVSVMFRRGERVAIIGENGIGKSTLLKLLVGDVERDAGEVKWGHETYVGYFPQDHARLLAKEGTAQSWLWGFCADEALGRIRSRLGAVLFSGDDAEKPLKALSGGEQARLVFAKLTAEQPNVLVLDEPTNHLDLESIEALVEALLAYEGTLLFVSHDRWFVQQLATRVIELRKDGMDDYAGTYDELLARGGMDHLDHEVALKQAKAPVKSAAAKVSSREGYEEQKKRKRLEAQRDKAEAAVAEAEARLKEIEQRFAAPGFFETTATAEVRALADEQEELRARVSEQLAQWERLEGELASMVSQAS